MSNGLHNGLYNGLSNGLHNGLYGEVKGSLPGAKAVRFSNLATAWGEQPGLVSVIKNDAIGTICAWVNLTSLGVGSIFSLTNTASNESINLDSIRAFCNIAGANKWVLNFDVLPKLKQWSHLVVVHNGISPVLYLNGFKAVQSFSSTVALSAWAATALGRPNQCYTGVYEYSGGGVNPLDGYLSSVSYYNTALSPNDVYKIWNKGRAGDIRVLPSFLNCKAWYRYGEGTTGFVTKNEALISGTDSTLIGMTNSNIVNL